MELSTTDIIQIISIIASLITSIIAIIISIVSVRQNAASIKAMSRPYISIYFESTQFGTPLCYFVIKNFGQSAGRILDLSFNDPVKDTFSLNVNLENALKDTIGMQIAPNQHHFVAFRINDFKGDIATFDLLYGDTIHQYREHFVIPVKNYRKHEHLRVLNTDTNKTIAYVLQELAERQL